MGYSAEKSVKSSFLVAKNGKSLRKNIFISLLYRYCNANQILAVASSLQYSNNKFSFREKKKIRCP